MRLTFISKDDKQVFNQDLQKLNLLNTRKCDLKNSDRKKTLIFNFNNISEDDKQVFGVSLDQIIH